MRNPDIHLRKEASHVDQSAQRPEDVARAALALAERATYADLAALFAVLADPTRVGIVHLLSDHELCTADVALLLRLNRPAASQHLRVLRDLRLVRARREGRLVLYRLADPLVARVVGLGLDRVRR